MRFSFNAVVKFETSISPNVLMLYLAPIIVAALRAEFHDLLVHSMSMWL